MHLTQSLTIIAAILFAAGTASAESVQIHQSIQMSSNTGNKQVTNGQTVSGTSGMGTSTNTIDVRTVVNGKVIEDIHLSSTTPIRYRSNTSFASSSTKITLPKISTTTYKALPATRLVASTSIVNVESSTNSTTTVPDTFFTSVRSLAAQIYVYATSWLWR